MELEQLAAALNLPSPLTPAQVTEARQRFGPNTISSGRSASWYSLLFSAAFHPFNVLLGILADVKRSFDTAILFQCSFAKKQ